MTSSLHVVLVLSLVCVASCGVVTSSGSTSASASPSSPTATSPSSPVILDTTAFETSESNETVTAAPIVAVTEVPMEEATTIIEIEEPVDGSNSSEYDFVNLPGYGVIDDANSTLNESVFSCFNRRYGYYADIAKKCYMFHLCYPVQEPATGQILFQRFSFVCSDNAVFDQQHLVCVDNGTLSYACQESNKYFIESNNKLIASMHQSQAAAGAQAYAGPPTGLVQEQPAAIRQSQQARNEPNINRLVATAQQQAGQPESPADETALAAAEAAYREYVREIEESAASGNQTKEETEAQYALLEQLFG